MSKKLLKKLEQLPEKPWRDYLVEWGKGLREPTTYDSELSSIWMQCAIGESDIIDTFIEPKEPKDKYLYQLGGMFHEGIVLLDWELAALSYLQIQQRAEFIHRYPRFTIIRDVEDNDDIPF